MSSPPDVLALATTSFSRVTVGPLHVLRMQLMEGRDFDSTNPEIKDTSQEQLLPSWLPI